MPYKDPMTRRLRGNETMAAWRAANPGKSREQSRASKARQRLANPQMDKNAHAAYNLRHPGRARANLAAWQHQNPDARRIFKIRQLHGIDAADMLSMMEAQNFQCANTGCGKFLVFGARKSDAPRVDHNHTTGAIRGLLCNQCNLALGLLRDDPGVIAGLVGYAKAHA